MNYVARVREQIEEYNRTPAEELTVCVSTGNVKVGKVLNVSLPPIISCPNCKGCSRECYDVKDARYPEVLKARARNWSILTRNPGKYFADIENAIRKHPSFRYFRWHVGGDIPLGDVGRAYFGNMIQLAREFPGIRFWAYTKNYYVVNQYVREHGGSIESAIPANLSIMFSQWRGIPLVNPFGFAEFRAYYDDEEVPEGIMECTGDCRICEENGLGCPYRQTVWTRIRGQIKK